MESVDQLPILPVISPQARPGTAPSGRRQPKPRPHGGAASAMRPSSSSSSFGSKQAARREHGDDGSYDEDDYSEFDDDHQSNASDISGTFDMPDFSQKDNGWQQQYHHLSRPHTAGTTASASSAYSSLGIVSTADSDGELQKPHSRRRPFVSVTEAFSRCSV